MNAIEPWLLQCLAATIFTIGFVGILIRRNIIVMMMCVELMLNAVNLSFVIYSRQLQDMAGQMAVLFVMTVAAAEGAVGLALVVAMFRTLRGVETDQIQILRE
jgi:NADH-quinone oxidoreductase subunit K